MIASIALIAATAITGACGAPLPECVPGRAEEEKKEEYVYIYIYIDICCIYIYI